MRLLFPFLLSALTYSCTPISQSSTNSESNAKILHHIDMWYEEQIRTVSLHPNVNDPAATLLPAITKLGDWNLVLEFDDLQPQRNNYYLRLVHCNSDWSKSTLQDLDFMVSFNEFPVNSYEFSVDTHIPYIHYWVSLPAVKLPGNYLAVVFREGDKNDIILSRRFMVFDPRVSFENERNLIGAGALASLNQQMNFTINYKNLDVINPLDNIKVNIRQNQRWDNIAIDIKPSFVREIEKQSEYRFFDDAKMFKGGSEFRFFDLRSLNQPGRNVQGVVTTSKPFEVFLGRDKVRYNEAYSQYLDANGGFIIANLDYNDPNFTNYANVNFILESKPLPGDVYVSGAFTNWNFSDENKMVYDSTRRLYQSRILMKQGYYDYQYVIKSKTLPPYYIEGSHFETENTYEIFVYYRPFQPQADLLVGYIRLDKNQR
jgi:hypothetical protein